MTWSFAGLVNHARVATLTATSAAATAPPSNLSDPRFYRRWITEGSPSSVTITVSYGGAEVEASHLGLFDVDLDPADVVTLRFFSDVSAQTLLGAPRVFAGRVQTGGALRHVSMPLLSTASEPAPVSHRALTIEISGAARERQAGYLDVSEISLLETVGNRRLGARAWDIDSNGSWKATLPLLSRAGLETLRQWHGANPDQPLVVLPELGTAGEGERAGLFAVDRFAARRNTRHFKEAWNLDLTLKPFPLIL